MPPEIESTSIMTDDDDQAVLATTIPVEWARDSLEAVAQALKSEAHALAILEDSIRLLREKTQQYASVCERPDKPTAVNGILPTFDRVRAARLAKFEAIQQVLEAKRSVCHTEILTAKAITFLTALVPTWLTGCGVDDFDATEAAPPRKVERKARR